MHKILKKKKRLILEGKGYDLALSVSTREYAEMSCARV